MQETHHLALGMKPGTASVAGSGLVVAAASDDMGALPICIAAGFSTGLAIGAARQGGPCEDDARAN